MPTTTLLQRHASEGETIAKAVRDCLDYGKNPEKTESGKYISAYECDPVTVADEFLLAKANYAAMAGQEQKNDVLCYQIRQSVTVKPPPQSKHRIPSRYPVHKSEYIGFRCDAEKFIYGICDCILKALICHIRAGIIGLVNRVCKSVGEPGMLASELRKILFSHNTSNPDQRRF